MVTKECSEPIRKLRTDNGGEYMSKDLQIYLTSKGIEHQLTVPHSPQQNGVAERLNRTLMESARAMLSHANLLKKLWAEAIATAAYLTLESYHHAHLLMKSSLHRLKSGMVTNPISVISSYLGVWPTVSPNTERRKLEEKAQRMCFIGYSKNPKGYRLIDMNTDKFVLRRDIVFNETDFQIFKASK